MGDSLDFRTSLFQSGGTTTGIIVPPEIVEGLGAGKKTRVVVVLNGFTYRSSIAVMGGDFMIPVSAEIRASAKVAGGDDITVQVSVDTEERKVEIPADFQALLDSHPAALAKFQALSYSNQKRHVLSIESAKTQETRQKRLEKAMQELSC